MVNPHIRAGTTKEIDWAIGTWLFLDIGFSHSGKTCGLLLHEEEEVDEKLLYSFDQACQKILQQIKSSSSPINLVIEAPLSVAFDGGNPVGRSIEREQENGVIGKTKTRYWYVGAGCAVMTAAIYLVKEIYEKSEPKEIRLFEAFVSFKGRDRNRLGHAKEVKELRRIVQTKSQLCVIDSAALKREQGHSLRSAFDVIGLKSVGIPPVIMWSQ